MRSTLRTAALCAAIAAVAAPACAQPGPPPPHAGSARFQAMREAHERQRTQDLRTVLRLRPDQEPALAAFLGSRRPAEPPERGGPAPQALTTPQRLDEMTRREAGRTQARQRRADAERTFYAALDGQQRQVFDALRRLRHGDHGRPGPAGRGPGGWGHGGPGHGGFAGPPPGD